MKKKIIDILKSAKANNWGDAAIATTITMNLLTLKLLRKNTLENKETSIY